jgi:hypothetical protein
MRCSSKDPPSWHFLGLTRGSPASDPRDQIYGILGLVDEDSEIILPPPDYGKSVVTVYTEFVLYHT